MIDFEKDAGAIPDTKTNETAWHNGALFNATLPTLQPGDVLFVPNKTFFVMGGITATGLKDVTIQIDGTIEFSDDMKSWPRSSTGRVHECFSLPNATNLTVTSSQRGGGVFQGNGEKWWGIPFIGYLEIGENRPRLFTMSWGVDILVENIRFLQSPYWTFWASNMDGLEVGVGPRCHGLRRQRFSTFVDSFAQHHIASSYLPAPSLLIRAGPMVRHRSSANTKRYT